MPKRKELKFNKNNRPVRKSEFDPEREAYMSEDGGYTYCQWVEVSKGKWELKPTCIVNIGENEVTSEITIVLDDMDCADSSRTSCLQQRIVVAWSSHKSSSVVSDASLFISW